jgi:glutamine synthetase
METRPGTLTLNQLQEAVANSRIDTVIVGLVDLQGRIVGKRIPAEFFLTDIVEPGMHFCKYLLGTEMEMTTPSGYRMMSWEEGYGDWTARPDLSTIRELPWLPGTVLILSDVYDHDGNLVAISPRQVLAQQVERARKLGFEPIMATELEFYLWRETYESAQAKGYHDLRQSGTYLEDYHFLQSTTFEPFYRQVRQQMQGAGIPLISAKGEAGPGQYEMNWLHGPAITAGDYHAVFKHGLKEIALQHDLAVTFMAKPDHRYAGSSCHVHVSLLDRNSGKNVFASEGDNYVELSSVGQSFLAGQLALARDMTLLYAPTVNSYKRYAAASWAPVNVAWAYDNRTCGLRLVGQGQSLHVENRLPGADANPYLVLAGILAAGLWGVEHQLPCPPEYHGNAYNDPNLPRVPTRLTEAIELFEQSPAAKSAFGEDVVAHYLNAGRVEQEAYDAVVTSWERERYFERI